MDYLTIKRSELSEALRITSEAWKASDKIEDKILWMQEVATPENNILKLRARVPGLIDILTTAVQMPDRDNGIETVSVSGPVLTAFVHSEEGEDLKFSVNTAELLVKSSTGKVKLRLHTDEELHSPVQRVKSDETPAFTVPGEVLQEASRFLARTIKNPLAGQALKRSVAIQTVGDEIHFVATDGPHMALAKLDAPDTETMEAAVDGKLFDCLAQAMNTPDSVAFYSSGNAVLAQNARTAIRVIELAMIFPPYREILERPTKLSIPVDRKALSRTVSRVVQCSGAQSDLMFELTGEELKLSTKPGSEEPGLAPVDLAIPLKSEKKVSVIVRTRDLGDSTDACIGDEVLLSVCENENFLSLRDSRNWLQLFTTVAPN